MKCLKNFWKIETIIGKPFQRCELTHYFDYKSYLEQKNFPSISVPNSRNGAQFSS